MAFSSLVAIFGDSITVSDFCRSSTLPCFFDEPFEESLLLLLPSDAERPVEDLEGGLLVTANSVSFLALSSNFGVIRWYRFALYLARRCRIMDEYTEEVSTRPNKLASSKDSAWRNVLTEVFEFVKGRVREAIRPTAATVSLRETLQECSWFLDMDDVLTTHQRTRSGHFGSTCA